LQVVVLHGPQGKHGVSSELENVPTSAGSELDDLTNVLVQHASELLNALRTKVAQTLRQGGEAGHVREEAHGAVGLDLGNGLAIGDFNDVFDHHAGEVLGVGGGVSLRWEWEGLRTRGEIVKVPHERSARARR
jgi:hypothetical protein